jgi:ABC-type antimicrobial peptide transport system permease subunit
MRIPLLEGREFSDRDSENQPAVVIVGESTARRFWPGGSAVGKRIQISGASTWIQIVGVVKDIRWHEFDNEAVTNLYIYLPSEQAISRSHTVVLQTAVVPRDMAGAVRQVVHQIDRDLSISRARTMEDVVFWANAPRRFNMMLMGGFAVFALLLTSAGVYGSVAHSIANRKREFGIHLAMGASPVSLFRMLLGQSARLALAGAATGLIGTLLLQRGFAVLLYGTSSADPLTISASLVILFLAAAVASGIPAVRVMQLDPARVLREE